jgi:hypothetical protein
MSKHLLEMIAEKMFRSGCEHDVNYAPDDFCPQCRIEELDRAGKLLIETNVKLLNKNGELKRRIEELEAKVRRLESYDCSYAGLLRDDPNLIHCPIDKPCMKHSLERLEARHTALVEGLRGKIDLFENRRNTATNADSKSLWHIVSNELCTLLGGET